MKFAYEDLISGDPIPVQGVGHVRSPFLWELKPTKGVGYWRYNLFMNLMSWEKGEFLVFLDSLGAIGKKSRAALENPKVEVFDLLRAIESLREMLRQAMSFFMTENLRWDKSTQAFLAFPKREGAEAVGRIDRNNFEDVRDMILQMNYVSREREKSKQPKFTSEKSRLMWEKVQQFQKKYSNPKKMDAKMTLGNIISKLCMASNTYNLLNVYDLTVYQLYDQFFECTHLRVANLSERIFSHYGGKKFKMDQWLEPLNKK